MKAIPLIRFATLMFLAALPASAEDLFDPQTGYRVAAYRAPVPDSAPGARTVTLDEVVDLAGSGAILLDVLPGRPYQIAPDGSWIIAGRHETLPGAIWLPVVGAGVLEQWQQDYLEDSLDRLTAGRKDWPMVVFCKVDCWMSWNAARRIAALGYGDVLWFPGGSEAWADAGHPLSKAAPYPLRTAPR